MVDKQFGSAGSEVVFEEYLEGQELSFLSFVDGYTVKSLVPAQDHKQIFDNDQGPNTGGMGCYAPTPIASEKLVQEVHRTILQPTIDGMRKERMPFKGLLFTGIMLTKDGPKVLEYNVRFGDPETQTLLPLMDGDLAEVMLACTNRYLDTVDVKCKNGSCVTVVAAAGGYPGSYKKGDPITIDAEAYEGEDTNIFHAGTSLDSGTLATAGGRVLAATAVAPDLETALSKAYNTMSKIHFEGIYYRKDIAHRALSHYSLCASSHEGPEVPLTYASAGVSIDAGTELVNRIKPLAASTRQFGTKSSIGGFGGQVDLAAAGYEQSPIISSGVDGVGTKSRLAIRMNKHDTIGIDLVAMVANDILTEGAEPLWLMDTMNMHRLDVETGVSIVRGVANGCIQANCNLAGGETAELGDIIKEGHYILDASCSGALRKGRKPLPWKDDMERGDVLLGLTSSGPHSNGYSLIHKIIERSHLAFSSPAPWDPSTSVGLSLLTPTKIYVRALLPLFEKDLVKGAAHITGGGLVENLPRILPRGLQAEVQATSWDVPAVFRWLKREGNVEKEEMARVFNMGIGMVLVVAEGRVTEVTKMLEGKGEEVVRVGGLVGREEGGVGCVVHDLEVWDQWVCWEQTSSDITMIRDSVRDPAVDWHRDHIDAGYDGEFRSSSRYINSEIPTPTPTRKTIHPKIPHATNQQGQGSLVASKPASHAKERFEQEPLSIMSPIGTAHAAVSVRMGRREENQRRSYQSRRRIQTDGKTRIYWASHASRYPLKMQNIVRSFAFA